MAGRRDDEAQAVEAIEEVERLVEELDEDADWNEDEDAEDAGELPPHCEGGMSGWCGQLRRHERCYFNHPDGIVAVLAGTYGMWRGHQWVCTCPCHEVHDFPPCPHPDHAGQHERRSAEVDYDVQQALF
jgi:hypothetical protein